MKQIVIAAPVRTAVGKMGGTLKNMQAEHLAQVVLKGALAQAAIDPALVDEVILGHCRQTSDNPNIARVAALMAGIPESASAHTVMRQCASGMTAVQNGAMSILCGTNDVVLAGGTESMTNAIFYLRGARYGLGTGNATIYDSLTEVQYCSQPQDIYGRFNMGMTAENVADKHGITRQEQDAFAFSSQQKAAAAIGAGTFKDEIVPVALPQRKGDPIVFDTDEFPRAVTMEQLAKLPAVFREGGTVTAGNASGRNDGASALLLATKEKAADLGLKPFAKIVGMGAAGTDPRLMGLGPVASTEKALQYAGLTLDDIGLIEINEAFAAQSIGCLREMGLEKRMDIINVSGGAIALGHPVGSSGCRILVTLAHEMRRRGVKYGLATLCIAGGMGQSTILELI